MSFQRFLRSAADRAGLSWIPSRPGYYVRSTDGQDLRVTLAQTPRRAAALMAEDIVRLDPFQQKVWMTSQESFEAAMNARASRGRNDDPD